ncbi:MAG: homoserine dehydrogenase [Defluviitaleaceae bacterium]|nr:homoserine dehydrogenase [Defluviitaleaceae bacterium]MCL2263347.1 homoserine dehydrogenase [Defluviitaleaceae bacterium]
MVKIAILGYGVVGSGVAEVLQMNQAQIAKRAGENIEVKYVMDLRDLSGDPAEKLLVKDFTIIENDPEVTIVVESIGGETIAYDFAKRALLSGKSVCTPNKALMAKYGAELLALAAEKGVALLFEASVGGGIPLIRPFNDALLTDEIETVSGILNGTSNYILTEMSENGTSYAQALKNAQELGYAEQDPTADVGGFDACRKLSILLSLATGKQVDYEEILTEGIDKISTEDFIFASELGFTLKQIVNGRICKNGVEAITAPFLVPLGHPMSTVNEAYNAAWVKCKAADNVMLYGSGAGKYPTASAVISNIVDAVGAKYTSFVWSAEKMPVLPSDAYVKSKVIRVSCDNPSELLKSVKAEKSITLEKYPNFAAWLTAPQTETETAAVIAEVKKLPGFKSVEQVLRVFSE